jgi:hypothetical protein
MTISLSKDKKCYGPNKKILFKKQLFDLEVKGQGSTKVIMVCNTPPSVFCTLLDFNLLL